MKRWGREPECYKCIPEELWEENIDAFEVYTTVKTQIITAGMGQPIDLDYNAIFKVMELYDVEDKITTFEKVVTAGQMMIDRINSKKKNR